MPKTCEVPIYGELRRAFMDGLVSGHQITYRFRGPDNKPTDQVLAIRRDGDTATVEVDISMIVGGIYRDRVQIGSDTCNNVARWLEAAQAFLTLDIPTEEGQPKEGPGPGEEWLGG